jgi:hypothetical protein
MSQSYFTPKAEVRSAGHKGLGAFAVAPIAAGETVAAFGGTVCSREAFDALPDIRRIHALQIDDELYMIGPPEYEEADMFNHACTPNCGIVGNILLVAMDDIAVGDELSFDYAMCDAADYDEFVCLCEAEGCRRVVTSADWQRPELQQRYRGFMSSYLVRRIDAANRAAIAESSAVEH